MNPNYRGLAFLLSLGSLPLACTKEGNDTDTDNGTGPNPTSTGPNTGTGTGTTDDTPTTGAATTSGGTTGGNTSTTSTTGPVDTTTGPIDTTTGPIDTTTDTGGFTESDTDLPPPTDPTCIAYAAHYSECFPRYSTYRTYLAQYCESYKGYAINDGQACVDAFEALYVCFSKADCADFVEGPEAACPAEKLAADSACPSLGGGDPDTSSSSG